MQTPAQKSVNSQTLDKITDRCVVGIMSSGSKLIVLG